MVVTRLTAVKRPPDAVLIHRQILGFAGKGYVNHDRWNRHENADAEFEFLSDRSDGAQIAIQNFAQEIVIIKRKNVSVDVAEHCCDP